MKYIVTLNGNDYEVMVSDGTAEVLSVSPVGQTSAAPVAAPVAKPAAAPAPAAKPAPAPVAKPAASSSAGGTTVSAPMPGNILKLMVKQGDKVTSGQVLLVLEAMKMENEIFAPCDGTVTSVSVNTGATVNTGDVMVTIG